MQIMRTTVRIDDDLMAELKERAEREQISLTRLVNRTLRAGVAAARHNARTRKPYREPVARLGVPKHDLRKALAVVAALDDEAAVQSMAARDPDGG